MVDCSSNWQVVHRAESQQQLIFPDGLGFSDGQLYQAVNSGGTSRVITLPGTGGPARAVVDGEAHPYWVDQDQLVYIRRDATSGYLYSQPLPNGEPTRVPFEVDHTGRASGFPVGYALDADAFYWLYFHAYDKPTTLALWRTSRRDGSHSKQVEEFPASYRDNVYRVGDRLLTEHREVSSVHLWSFPLAGGTAAQLLAPDGARQVLGISADGRAILARRYLDQATRQEWTDLTQWAIEGTVSTAWWTNRSRSLAPLQVWDDGVGGFYAAALELTNDGAWHLTAWSVDRAGIGKRLGCDPEVENHIVGAAVGSDALYLTLRERNLDWRIVRIGADVIP